jgi:hypothetical protein
LAGNKLVKITQIKGKKRRFLIATNALFDGRPVTGVLNCVVETHGRDPAERKPSP